MAECCWRLEKNRSLLDDALMGLHVVECDPVLESVVRDVEVMRAEVIVGVTTADVLKDEGVDRDIGVAIVYG